jgi:hypothetical protein
MKIVFDQGTPAPLRKSLSSHAVSTLYELGWSTLQNGDLINHSEENGYELLITTDKNLKYQQNLKNRKIAILVLSTTSWPRIELSLSQISTIVNDLSVGSYTEINIP